VGSVVTTATEERTNSLAREERRSLDRVILSLSQRFPKAARSVIERAVDRRYLEFYGAPIREYIPIMVEREATDDLRTQLATMPIHTRMRTS
jgi:hypothetical protein